MNKPADTEPLAMSDNASSPLAEINAPPTDLIANHDDLAMEIDDGNAMGGLVPQQAAEMKMKAKDHSVNG